MALVQLIIAALATYRLAVLLPEDEGPLFIFIRIRNYFYKKAVDSYCEANSYKDDVMEMIVYPSDVTSETLLSSDNRDLGIWSNVYRGINCPYCCGLYAAILTTWLSLRKKKYGNVFLLIFAIAGAQSLLQKWSEK